MVAASLFIRHRFLVQPAASLAADQARWRNPAPAWGAWAAGLADAWPPLHGQGLFDPPGDHLALVLGHRRENPDGDFIRVRVIGGDEIHAAFE